MQEAKTDIWKSPARRKFEFGLLIISLCVLAIRATYPESPNTSTIDTFQILSNEGFSLVISSVLIFAFIAWLTASFVTGKLYYRFGWIEIGTALFLLGGCISVLAASDKRAAITDLTTISACILTAVMLIQILDTDIRLKLVLMTIIACAVTGTYKCAEQFYSSNQIMIEQYEQDPQSQLDQLGIETGSFQHFSYEHRLYSKDVRGFFTTGNSAGSLMLIGIFAALAFFWKRYKANRTCKLIAAALTAAVIYGLLLTHSKGAIAAAVVSAVMITAYLLFGKILGRFKIPILIICLIAITVTVIAAIIYGTQKNTLPGGNSMLVRWQYWTAAVKMYLLKPLTGIGPGNFGSYYTYFKDPAALETVKDPHNFPLSILSQYGPIGLTGFCLAFILPMLKSVFDNNITSNTLKNNAGNRKAMIITAISIAAVMLIFRPILLKSDMGHSSAETVFMIVYLFILPTLVFMIVYFMLIAGEMSLNTEANLPDTKLCKTTGAFLLCSASAVALHNMIDFAIFEPGISMAFWTVVACMTAWTLNKKNQITKPIYLNKPTRIMGIFIMIVLTWIFYSYALIRPVAAGKLYQESFSNLRFIHEKLDRAAKTDPLSSRALNFHGRIYLQQFEETAKKNPDLIKCAIDCFTEAINRDKANYKYYENLSKANSILAKISTGKAATGYREKAAHWMNEAIKRYPGSDRLNFQSAKLAENLERKQQAVKYYQAAIDIEESYRKMFRVMYPDREMFSRLGEENYQFAKSKLKELKAE